MPHSSSPAGAPAPEAGRREPRDAPATVYDAEILQQILELLPAGLAVRDAGGRVLMANGAAVEQIGARAAAFAGPDHLPPAVRAQVDRDADGREPGGAPISLEPISLEETVGEGDGERTLLTTYRSVRLGAEVLLLSAAIDITAQKQAEREIARRAYVDALTGLPNRTQIQDHAARLTGHRDPSDPFALVFIDLDNFKRINEYYGHPIADALLVEIARRMAAMAGPSDRLARFGGDEFMLLVDRIDGREQLQAVVDRVIAAFAQPFHVERFEVFLSASVGCSVYPEHGRTFAELHRNADHALFKAKSGAKGGAVIFDRQMGRQVANRMAMEQRLRLAIRDRRFCCAFQQKVDLDSDEVVGFEALARLRDDDGVIHAPGSFIDLAIELDLIDQITRLVLAEVEAALGQLDDLFGTATTMSINVAAKQAGNLKFMLPFIAGLEATRRADRFIIELTEDAFVAANHFQREVLPLLRQLGVRISIDDFGTGYSSLSALADITADEIKIDRSLITGIHRRPRHQSVLRAVESLAGALGMKIVAEGIETAEELAYLKAASGIRCVQGFYFGRPFILDEPAVGDRVAATGRVIEAARQWPHRAGRGR